MWRARVIIMLFGANAGVNIAQSDAALRRPENGGNRANGG